jgi:tetratricopeptide (TPR) repeat protein
LTLLIARSKAIQALEFVECEESICLTSPLQVSTIVNLGNVWGDLGNAALKKEYLERALALQEGTLKEKSSSSCFLELATILHNLGAAYGETGDFWKQRDALERALRIKETQVLCALIVC